MILQKLKADAEAYLGEHRSPRPSSPCLPTSTTAQRQATKDAGKIAGLECPAYHQRADGSRSGLRRR